MRQTPVIRSLLALALFAAASPLHAQRSSEYDDSRWLER